MSRRPRRVLTAVVYLCALIVALLVIPKMLSIVFAGSPLASGGIETTTMSSAVTTSSQVDLSWHAPNNSSVNDLSSAINGSGTYGFVFNTSHTPRSLPYFTYNWCNMPHVRPEGYEQPPTDEYKLKYVEVIHRHHKRTPYAANTFPVETDRWSCNDATIYHYGAPNGLDRSSSAQAYLKSFTESISPFTPAGYPPYDCQFPQVTSEGLDDSWQHGRDLYAVYHDKVRLLPDEAIDDKVTFRVTNNEITSQVAGMLANGMTGERGAFPLLVQPPTVDSLEPKYPCPAANDWFASIGPDSDNPTWQSHLRASQRLFDRLDRISGIPPSSDDWHRSWDHYFDNLSARLCHAMPLPCNATDPSHCITQADADEVFRLGEGEYSWQYRGSGHVGLVASAASFGVWLEELAQHLRRARDGMSGAVYRHNVAHDGSLARLLSVLQVDYMVWPGMGAEVVFEMYSGVGARDQWYVRVLWGGQVLRSSNPSLGRMHMVPLETLLAYFDGLAGRDASFVRMKCSS